MRIWKKALSTAMSAALLASLLGTAFASSAFAATNILNATSGINPASGVQADGISTVVIAATAAADPLANTVLVTTSAGTFVAVGSDGALGTFSLVTGQPQQVSGSTGAYAATDTITLRAPSAPATGTINVYLIPTGGGNAVLDQTFTVSFYASGSTAVSAANTTVTASGTTLKADGSDSATVTVVVKDGVSPTPNTLTTGITVNASITPVGLVANNTVVTFSQVSADNASTYVFTVKGSGLSGTGVLALSVTTTAGVTTTLPPVSFVFTGSLASIKLANASTVGAVSTTKTDAITFVGKDAAGNVIPVTAASLLVTAPTYSTGAPFTITAGSNSTATAAGTLNAVCGATAGTGTVAVTSGSVVSNAVPFNCSTPADTYSVKFDKTTVAPGGQATITVTVKDAGGRPAPDGLGVSILVSSGATLATTAGVTASGVATWTFLAPFNTGVVTVLASATVLTSSSPQSASISVSAPAPLPGTGTNASALGVTTSGPFSTTTKVAALGRYQTFKISFGAGAAGQTVGIWVQTKNSAGVWSSSTRVTGRVADSSGNVYYYVRNSSAAWISLRGDLAGSLSNAVQGRWR